MPYITDEQRNRLTTLATEYLELAYLTVDSTLGTGTSRANPEILSGVVIVLAMDHHTQLLEKMLRDQHAQILDHFGKSRQ